MKISKLKVLHSRSTKVLLVWIGFLPNKDSLFPEGRDFILIYILTYNKDLHLDEHGIMSIIRANYYLKSFEVDVL